MSDLVPEWGLVGAQVIGGLALMWATAAKVAPKIRDAWVAMRAKQDHAEVLRNARVLRHLGALLREWIAKKGAQRALLLHAKNNGKPWPPNAPIFVSCLDQVVAQSEKNTWDRWQDWRVDPGYRSMLYDLLSSQATDRGVLLVTDTLESSVLRDAYAEQGTVASVVFAIRWLPENALVYVSLNFGRSEAKHKMTAEERRDYEMQARALFNAPDRIRSMIAAGRGAWRT